MLLLSVDVPFSQYSFRARKRERERATPSVEAIAIADAATAYYLIKGIVVDDKRRSFLCSFIALSPSLMEIRFTITVPQM